MSSPLDRTDSVTTLTQLTANLSIEKPQSPLQKLVLCQDIDSYIKQLQATLIGKDIPVTYASHTLQEMQEDILLLFSLWVKHHQESHIFLLLQILPYYADRLESVDEKNVRRTICTHHLIAALEQSEKCTALAVAARVSDFIEDTTTEVPQLNNEWSAIKYTLIKLTNQYLNYPTALIAKSLASWQHLTQAPACDAASFMRLFASIEVEWDGMASKEHRYRQLSHQTFVLYDSLLDSVPDSKYMLELLFVICKTDPIAPCSHRYSSGLWVEELGSYATKLFIRTVNRHSFPSDLTKWLLKSLLRNTATPASISLAAAIFGSACPEEVDFLLKLLAKTKGPIDKQAIALQAILDMPWVDYQASFHSTKDESALQLIEAFATLAKRFKLSERSVRAKCVEKIDTLIRQKSILARKDHCQRKESLYIKHLRSKGPNLPGKENQVDK